MEEMVCLNRVVLRGEKRVFTCAVFVSVAADALPEIHRIFTTEARRHGALRICYLCGTAGGVNRSAI